MALALRVPCALVLSLTGCSLITDSFVTNEFSGDEFPIAVDMSSGALRLGVRTDDTDRSALLDVLSPVTIVDPGHRWTVDPTRFASRGRNTPLAGVELTGAVRAVVLDGEVAYEMEAANV